MKRSNEPNTRNYLQKKGQHKQVNLENQAKNQSRRTKTSAIGKAQGNLKKKLYSKKISNGSKEFTFGSGKLKLEIQDKNDMN